MYIVSRSIKSIKFDLCSVKSEFHTLEAKGYAKNSSMERRSISSAFSSSSIAFHAQIHPWVFVALNEISSMMIDLLISEVVLILCALLDLPCFLLAPSHFKYL